MGKRPWSLVMAAVIVALEGLVALGLGIYVAVETVLGEAGSLTAALAEAAFGVLIGAGLLWVAWGGLLAAERWGRAPSVVTQLFIFPVAFTLIQADQPALGIPLIVVALAGLGMLLARPTTRALLGDEV
ncbi:hypothetical protein OUY22_16005 [Nonomuraea sp. MCN248]|uniref:Integral membrane protein n=1 Tax=Nonomuraea corallina TaxID=2989783 RepID=A0ABT4SCJ2_9ACTN|nr:hypothetical protein [Nonomuraea corallina]MDA0634928.1 hypothetical protein [Nonomuraea corallina]